MTAHGSPAAVPGAGAPGPASPARLAVRDLEIRSGHGGPPVVSGISFTIQAGRVLGLVGESGSGKTTVALALLGHARRGLAVSRGEVCLDGVDLLRQRPAALRRIRGARVSYVPQDPAAALNPALRIGYQLREALRVHAVPPGDAEARIGEVLHEARLEPALDLLRRYPHQLSGGQQQRVGLAMAFACRPALIVLDEPTTGLDVSTQRHVLETLRRLCGHYQVAAVYVSHDLAVVSGLATEVAVMYAGRIVEAGPASTLLGQPLHPYTAALLAAVPSPGSSRPLAGIPGQPPPPGQRGGGCGFAPRCALALDECRAREPEPAVLGGRTVRCLRPGQAPGRPAGWPPGPAATRQPPIVLSLRGVAASYGGVPALAGIDLDVPAQGCVAVVGESGSGKTTLARCITGLHRGWTGQAELHGEPLARAARQRPKQALRQVQYVFQNPYTSLHPRKTVGQLVAEPLQRFFRLSRPEQAERVHRVLDDVSLGGRFLSRYPGELSGGERQRVAIARALVVEPDVLVCDEVTSALDVSVQAVIVDLLRAAAARHGLAMVFITHNLALVPSVAQFAVVLRCGELVEAGTVEQVLSRPRSDYTARLIADAPRLS